MLLFYVDECGDAKAWDATGGGGSSPYFVLSAVGISDTSREPIARDIGRIRSKYLPDAKDELPWSHGEIKGRYLATAARAVDKGSLPARAVFRHAFGGSDAGAGLLGSLGNVFARFRPLVFSVVVDKAKLASGYPHLEPLGAAYALLNLRVAQVLDKAVAGEGAMFVADQQHEHERHFRDGRATAAREAFTDGREKTPSFARLMDKPLWIDPELSVWDREILQLADIVAYSTYELAKTGKAPFENYYLWSAIEPWLARNWAHHATPAGAGLSIFPKPKAYPTLTA